MTGSGAILDKTSVAGEILTAGMPVYRKAADGKIYKAKGSGTAAEAVVIGIATHSTGINQPIAVQTAGQITCGGTILIGTFYYASGLAYGGFGVVADLSSGMFPTIIGYGVTIAILQVLPIVPGLPLT